MANGKIDWDRNGIEDLLRSKEIEQELHRRASKIAAAAGPGMEASSTQGRRRALAMVRTATTQARLAEATNRALTRAIDAGRG